MATLVKAPTRSEALAAELGAAWTACCVVALHGEVHDHLQRPDGEWGDLPVLLAVLSAHSGRTVVRLEPEGCEQVLHPGGRPVPVRLPAPDGDPLRALAELTGTLEAPGASPLTVLVRGADFLLAQPDAGTGTLAADVLRRWSEEPALRAHRLVIATALPLDSRLLRRPGIHEIQVPRPDLEERRRLVGRLADQQRPGCRPIAAGLTAEEVAAASGGLRCTDIVELFTGTAGALTADAVLERKRRELTGSGGVRLLHGAGFDEVAGLPQVELAVREWEARGTVPRVILLAGPPGCGKTLVFTAIAGRLGRTPVELGEFRSQWVGATEIQLRGLLDATDALAPALVLVDEADLLLPRRSSGPSADAGTNERAMAMIWTHLGDRRDAQATSWFLTTNRPSALDEAAQDRVGEVLPILHPEPEDASRIFALAVQRDGLALSPSAAAVFAESLRPFTSGRAVVRAAGRAAAIAQIAGRQDVRAEDVRQALADTLPGERPEAVELMSLQAIRLATYASRLPWVAARLLGRETEPPSWVRPLLDDQGKPVRALLDRRIAELQAAG